MFSADCGRRKDLPGGTRLRGRVRLYMNALLVYSGTMDDEAAGRFVSLLRDIETSNSNEFIRIRGSAVTLGGDEAVVFPSEPHTQLPALAATLVRSGAGYLGDEVVNLDPVLGRVHPLELPVLLDAEDLGRFPELGRRPSKGRATRGGGANSIRRPVLPSELGGNPAAQPTPVGRMLFPEFLSGEQTAIQPVPASEALFALSKASLNLHVWGERALLLFQRLLREVEVARLVIGDLEGAGDLVMGRRG
jgi:hypothetical protein